MKARIALGDREVAVDLSRPVSLAVEVDFAGPQARHFGAPPASARPFTAPGFAGSVEHGASCNCQIITLIPHCNGTHTECVGHLTRERLDAWRVAPPGPLPALLLTVDPEPAGASGEGSDPAPASGDLLITAHALAAGWPRELPFVARALVVRTRPNDAAKRHHDYSAETPPYLSREAAALLVERGIEHLIVDLPSIDRVRDQGRLTAHRRFFGLPGGSSALALAARPGATVTELAFVPEELADGACLVELQLPALAGDAVPSRPLLYPLAP
ncbi:MAG TPA: cyclase family protein [Steroidobacteraceae bacterium]|nr:cyclase family protein [Steroidobacteraceae bacterium]